MKDEVLAIWAILDRLATDAEIKRVREIIGEKPVLIRLPEMYPWLKLNCDNIVDYNRRKGKWTST